MKRIRGPRPVSIRIFAALFLFIGLSGLLDGLTGLPAAQKMLGERFGWISWDREWTIIALSAQFTISLIPVTLIYLFASRFARWLMVIFGMLKLGLLVLHPELAAAELSLRPMSIIPPVILVIAIGMLFTAGPNAWFRNRGNIVAAHD